MPVYEFQCADCQGDFDELVRSPEAVKDVVCPSCGSRKVKKKLSTFSAKISGGNTRAVAAPACAPGGT